MKALLKAAAFAGLLAATGAQAADLSAPASVDGYGYKDEIPSSWWNAGDIFVRVRVDGVIPEVSTSGWNVPGAKLDVNASVIPEADISYFLTKNIAVEMICCVSENTIDGKGALSSYGSIGRTWVFPPTVLLQYHFDMAQFGLPQLKPYVGAGVNYTVFFDESANGGSPAKYSNLKINDAWGAALQIGADYHLTGNWFANVDVKQLFLDTSDSVYSGTLKATAHNNLTLDPTIVGVGIGYRFGTGYAPLK